MAYPDLWKLIRSYFHDDIIKHDFGIARDFNTDDVVLELPKPKPLRRIKILTRMDLQDNLHLVDPFVVAMVATALSITDKRWDAGAIDEAVHDAALKYCERIYRRGGGTVEGNLLCNRQARARYIELALERVYPMLFSGQDTAAPKPCVLLQMRAPVRISAGLRALLDSARMTSYPLHVFSKDGSPVPELTAGPPGIISVEENQDAVSRSDVHQDLVYIQAYLHAITGDDSFLNEQTVPSSLLTRLAWVREKLHRIVDALPKPKGSPVREPDRPDRKPAGTRW